MNMEMPDGDQSLGRWPRAKEITTGRWDSFDKDTLGSTSING